MGDEKCEGSEEWKGVDGKKETELRNGRLDANLVA